MRAETHRDRRRVTDPGPNWIRSGEDLLATDPVERVVFETDDRPPSPPRTAHVSPDPASRRPPEVRGTHPTPVPSKSVSRPNRLMLAPSLPPMIAPDSLPPIYDDEAFVPSCRAVDASYSGVVAGVRASGRTWSQEELRRPAVEPEASAPSDSPTPTPAESSDARDFDDEASTGIFEPGEDPYAHLYGANSPLRRAFQADQAPTVAQSSLDEVAEPWLEQAQPAGQEPPPQRPSLALVRSVSESVEEEFAGMRAAPLATEPRPVADEVVDWPPPMVRPGIDYPPDWSADEVGNTLIVIDPLQRRDRSRIAVLFLDIAAWILGFVAMFLTGLVTTGSAALVFFALSL